MRTYFWFAYFIFYLIALSPKTWYVHWRTNRGEKEKMAPIVTNTVFRWADRLLHVAGVTSQVEGMENIPQGAALFVSNHQGNFDTPLMLCRIGPPRAMVAKKELLKLPIIRTWMTFFDCIFMDREDPRQSLQSLNQAQALLTAGKSVVIFPEGTRSKGHEMGEFKSGALRCALKAGVPIVPVAIDGSYKAMEAQGIHIRPTCVKITVLPPIHTEALSRESTKTLSSDVQQMIRAVLDAGKQTPKESHGQEQ